MDIRAVPQIAVDFITRAETEVLRVYDDKQPDKVLRPGDVVLGTLTAGTGHTGGLTIGMTVTRELAAYWRAADLETAAQRLYGVVHGPIIAALSEHQYSALLSFVFNLGAGASWTIWKVLNANRLDQVPTQMLRFDKEVVDGKAEVVAGLDHRRMAEIALWKTADAAAITSTVVPSAEAIAAGAQTVVTPGRDTVGDAIAVLQASPTAPPPSSVTRNGSTPPTPAAMKPLAQSKSFLAQCATAIGGMAAAAAPFIDQLHRGLNSIDDAIKPYTDGNAHVAQIESMFVIGLAGTAALSVILTIRKQIAMTNQ